METSVAWITVLGTSIDDKEARDLAHRAGDAITDVIDTSREEYPLRTGDASEAIYAFNYRVTAILHPD